MGVEETCHARYGSCCAAQVVIGAGAATSCSLVMADSDSCDVEPYRDFCLEIVSA
jgi:hypothetical protein